MFEVTGLFLIVFFVGACAFSPLGGYFVAAEKSQHIEITVEERTANVAESKIPEDSVLRRHFLTNLQAGIEATFAPRPTDSVLKRHHDALVAAEMENRLAELTA
jgi:hypothetical protein